MWNESRQQQFLEYLLTFLLHNTVSHMPESRSGHTKVNSCINLSYWALECILYQLKLPLFWLAALGPLQRNLLLSERMLANKRYNPYLIKNILSTGRWKLYAPSSPLLYHQPKHPPLHSAICHAHHASRQGPGPQWSRTGCCTEGIEARITPPNQPAPPCLAAPMHTVVFPCRQHRTAQLQSPAGCEQCLRVIVILWNQ